MSFLIWDILIFMASSSSSGTSGILGTASDSSTIWKLRSVSGMYHLQSYCWLFLKDRRSKPFTVFGNTLSPSHKSFPAIVHKTQNWAQLHCDPHVGKVWQRAAFQQESREWTIASTARNKATCFVVCFFLLRNYSDLLQTLSVLCAFPFKSLQRQWSEAMPCLSPGCYLSSKLSSLLPELRGPDEQICINLCVIQPEKSNFSL